MKCDLFKSFKEGCQALEDNPSRCVDISCLKSRNTCRSSYSGTRRASNHPKVNEGSSAHQMEEQLSHSSRKFGTKEDLCQVCSAQSHSHISKRNTLSQLVKMSFSHVRQSHTFSVASLLVMSLGIFCLKLPISKAQT